MSPGRAFRRLAACAMLAAFGLAATPAAAVDKLVNTPAEKFETAPGGVDMRTGRYVYSETDLAIGGEGSAGLTLSRILNATAAGHANPFGNLSHNWDVMISEKRINADNPQESGLDFEIHVHFAGRSQTYQSRYIYSGYRQVSSGASASLTYVGDRTSGSVVYTYTAADGTVATFRPLGNGDCSSARRCAYVSEIVEADGTRYSFGYAPAGGDGGNARLAQVISSRGYALLLEGGGHEVTKACVLNLTQVAIPSGGACPAGVPTTSYGYTTYSGTRLASVVRADGQTESFTYGAAANGGIAMGFVKPGQPSAWLTNSFHLRPDEEEAQQEIMDRQDLAGGESYSYGFNLSPAVTYKPQTIAGGAWTDAAGEGMDVTYDWPIAPGANHPGSACTPPGCTWPMAEDQQESWVYQQTPGPVSISDALGRTTSFGFCDAAAMAGLPATEHNRCIVLRDAQFVIDPEGIRTDLKYDGNGNVIQAIRHPKPGVPGPDGAVPADIVTSAVYDTAHPKSADKPLSMTDANGRTTSWTYAPEHGGVLTETGPQVNGIAPQKRYAYELRAAVGGNIWVPTAMSMCRTSAATGNPASPCAGGDEVLTTYQYGSGNLLLLGQAVTADGATLRTCFAYDGQGRRISETSPNGTVGLSACPASPPAGPLPYTKSTRYDAMGRVTGTIAPPVAGTHQAVRNSYDPAARLTRVEEGRLSAWQGDWVAPASWTGFAIFRIVDTSYDALDRKTREMVSGDGATASVTEYGYDLGGRLKCTAVRMNPDAWATPLADKCVPGPAHATYGHDRISKNVYDAAGQATESWDGVGTSLARREAAWTYNGNGQKTSLTDSRGFLAQMVYDAFGRQRFWYFPMPATTGAANANDYEEYRYDPAGNRTWLRKRDGAVLTFGYDALSRMTQKNVPTSATGAAGYSVFYGYDNRGLQRYARFGSDSGLGVTSDYDGFGRLLSSTSSVDGVGRAMASQYDSDGNRTLLTGPWGYYAPFAYDGLGRVTGNANITLFGYDSAGRRSSLAMGPGWTSSAVGYQYDEAGRLKTLTHDLAGTSGDQALGFAYNPASRIVARTATNDAYAAPAPAVGSKAYGVNRMWLKTMPDPAGHVRYLYDLRGLQTDAWYPWTGEGISNRYDGFGRLIETTSTMGGFARKIAHAFDRDGRRVELTWSDQAKIWFTRDRLGRIREGYQGALGTTSTIMIAFAYNSGGPPHYFARRGGGSPTNMTGSAVPSRRPARRAGSRAPSATPSTATAGGWSRAGPIRPGSGSPATS